MAAHEGVPSESAAAYSPTDALAALLLILSHAFSYPSMEQARWRTSTGFASRVIELLALSGAEEAPFLEHAAFFTPVSAQESEHYAKALRVEHTRLFVVTPRLIALTGTRWVQQPGSLSRRQSERVLVQRAYDDLSLCNQNGVTEPADHIVSELDYAAYVTASESEAWKGGDAASAQEWKLLRDDFVVEHLASLAFGVAGAIKELSRNDHLKGHAALLESVVRRCML